MKNRSSFFQRNKILVSTVVTLLFVVSAGCASWKGEKGVVNKWRDETVPPFEKGKTIQSDVVEALGPPSQVIGLNDGIVFYYMLEKTKGSGLFLLVYNTKDVTIRYDRAIFFFDENGVLTDYGYSHESAPYEEAP
ncbi:MAG: hypothetical protein JRI70_08300 [Deltaproteobacteria bacterium]|nr:hypothetical protein [Deltaproteobacteria bacterium]MBW2172329.1 hypothetical protein [Deltaproteobacteria bacterium]